MSASTLFPKTVRPAIQSNVSETAIEAEAASLIQFVDGSALRKGSRGFEQKHDEEGLANLLFKIWRVASEEQFAWFLLL